MKDYFVLLSRSTMKFPLKNLTALWGKTLRQTLRPAVTHAAPWHAVWSVIFLPSLTHTGSTKRRYPLLSQSFSCSWLTGRRSHFRQTSNFYAEVADDLKGKVVTKQKWGGERKRKLWQYEGQRGKNSGAKTSMNSCPHDLSFGCNPPQVHNQDRLSFTFMQYALATSEWRCSLWFSASAWVEEELCNLQTCSKVQSGAEGDSMLSAFKYDGKPI